MFDWIASVFSPGEVRNGLPASPKMLRALMAELDAEPPERVLRMLTQRFDSVPAEAPVGRGLRRAVMRLDEYAQRAVAELWGCLLSGPRGLSLSEDNWSSLAGYYRSLHACCWSCLRNPKEARAASEQDHGDAIVVAARAMSALAKYMLLLRMRYRQADREVWSHVNSLVDWAQAHGHRSAEMELYPETGIQTTIERELLSALLIEVAPTPNLLPAQMHALDRLLRLHASAFRLSGSYDEQVTPFAHDVSKCKAPQRWLPQLPVHPGLQFFGVAGAYVDLCAEKDNARSAQKVPVWLAATRCSTEDYRDLLERLVSAWSLHPPQRRHRRDPCAGEILVAHDWGEIRRLIKFSELARSGRFHGYESSHTYGINSSPRAPMDRTVGSPGLTQPMAIPAPLDNLRTFERMLSDEVIDTWTLTDSSEQGMGAVAPSARPWVKVGMMIAFRYPDSVDWQLALIRRLNCSDVGRLTIGMTRICGSVCSARLRLGASAVPQHPGLGGGDPTVVEYDALVVCDSATSLFIPAGVFDRSWSYTLHWNNRRDIVRMEKSIERGLNYERVETSAVESARAA